MKITGTITSAIPANGVLSVDGAQYANVPTPTIIARFRITPATGRPVVTQVTIAGADVAALGPSWGDDDLMNWFVTQNGLTNADAAPSS